MVGGINQDGNMVVSSFAVAKKYTTSPNNGADGSNPPETIKSEEGPSTEDAVATTPSNSAQQGIPPPDSVSSVVCEQWKNDPNAIPALNYLG